jgi:hypothetical protein
VTQSLATQLIIATAMVALTVVTHLLRLSVLIAAANRHSRRLRTGHALTQQMLVLVGVSFGLFILHSVEIWSYATFYATVGAIEGANGVILLGWSTAFFVSVVARIRALEHDWSGGSPGNQVSMDKLDRGRALDRGS